MTEVTRGDARDASPHLPYTRARGLHTKVTPLVSLAPMGGAGIVERQNASGHRVGTRSKHSLLQSFYEVANPGDLERLRDRLSSDGFGFEVLERAPDRILLGMILQTAAIIGTGEDRS
jgi:hypothetical protein